MRLFLKLAQEYRYSFLSPQLSLLSSTQSGDSDSCRKGSEEKEEKIGVTQVRGSF
jgi:hypothetical protein